MRTEHLCGDCLAIYYGDDDDDCPYCAGTEGCDCVFCQLAMARLLNGDFAISLEPGFQILQWTSGEGHVEMFYGLVE